MNKIWIYTALAACLGGGYGAGIATSPSQHDLAQALRQGQQASLQDCELTVADRAYLNGKVRNSRGKEF